MYGDPRLRSADAVRRNTRGQAELWKYGISGDLPILLVHIKDGREVALLRDLLKAHEYLRRKGLAFDLVVLNDHGSSYLQDLQNTLLQMVEGSPEQSWVDRPGGVFLRRADLMPPEDRTLLEAAARVVMDGADGNLREQLKRPQIPFGPEPGQIPRVHGRAARSRRESARAAHGAARPSSRCSTASAGLPTTAANTSSSVDQDAGALPPQPWSNVVAHPTFGFAATESGPGYTWSRNSHDNRLTPWRNDPVSDPPGEAMFIRDEETGQFWSATPLPAGAGQPYIVRHGQGYTTFEHARNGLASTLLLFVPPTDEVKVFHLTLRNESAARAPLHGDAVRGVGARREPLPLPAARRHEPRPGDRDALCAQSRSARSLPIAWRFSICIPARRRRSPATARSSSDGTANCARPAAMRRASLSDRTGAALDPCGAIQVAVVLAAVGDANARRPARRRRGR